MFEKDPSQRSPDQPPQPTQPREAEQGEIALDDLENVSGGYVPGGNPSPAPAPRHRGE